MTEEDAASAPDGNPKIAARAARMLALEAAEATAKQQKLQIPVQPGFFHDGDAGTDGVTDENGSMQSKRNKRRREDREDEYSHSGSEDDDSYCSNDSDSEESDSSDDDDGYGEDGLSWEAVMESLTEKKDSPERVHPRERKRSKNKNK